MEQRRAVIVAIAIALLVALAIIGTIVFLSNFLRNKSTSTNRTVVSSSAEPVVMATAEASATPATSGSATASAVAPANTKSTTVGGYTGFYPNTWGVLSCSNSENIEFDPNGTDSTVACNYAKKPITVIVAKTLNCKGEEVTLGNNTVIKSKAMLSHEVRYRWCVKGADTNLDITHRVTDSNLSAASKEDFSAQVEQFISTLTFPRGS